MPNIRDMTFDSNGILIQAVLMAPPGKGKTTLAGTFPRAVFWDFDGKIGVLRNPWFLRAFGLRSVEYETFPEPAISHGNIVPSAFDNACRYFDKWMSPNFINRADTFVVDSGTTLSMVARAKALYVLGKTKRSKTLDRKVEFAGMEVMEQTDWGAERSLVEQFIRMLLESKKNVLINVHEKEVVKNGVTQILPLFTGDSKVVIPAMVKDVWHLRDGVEANKLVRVLQAEPIGDYQLRSELGIDRIPEPTYDKIISRIKDRQVEALGLIKDLSLSEAQGASLTSVSQDTTVPAKV